MTGYAPSEVAVSTATAVTDGGAVETVIVSSRPVNTPGPGATVSLFGVVNITTGTAGTQVVLRFVRGDSAAGVDVGTATIDTTTAADDYTIPFNFTDEPGDVVGLVYSVTVTETSATADGTVNYASIGGFIS